MQGKGKQTPKPWTTSFKRKDVGFLTHKTLQSRQNAPLLHVATVRHNVLTNNYWGADVCPAGKYIDYVYV